MVSRELGKPRPAQRGDWRFTQFSAYHLNQGWLPNLPNAQYNKTANIDHGYTICRQFAEGDWLPLGYRKIEKEKLDRRGDLWLARWLVIFLVSGRRRMVRSGSGLENTTVDERNFLYHSSTFTLLSIYSQDTRRFLPVGIKAYHI